MIPIKKASKSQKRRRRAHHALPLPNLVSCPKCGKPKLPHCACGVCGYVSAKQTLPIAAEEA